VVAFVHLHLVGGYRLVSEQEAASPLARTQRIWAPNTVFPYQRSMRTPPYIREVPYALRAAHGILFQQSRQIPRGFQDTDFSITGHFQPGQYEQPADDHRAEAQAASR
jgi:hypothetical protein